MLLLLWDGFPPGADIGLHNSVIYSITGSGNVDFLYNFYHIGGGVSLTFPGYHIFTAGVMMLTGLPEYVAHAAVVALFSSLIVLCTFLVTKRVWSTSAAIVVAFLAAISRFDIEMLMWAGYPNVITLMLIPLTFYLYLEKDRFSKAPFFVSTSILAASMLLTHSLSIAMFALITAITMLFVLAFPAKLGVPRKTAVYWFLPIILGVILVSPFLVKAVPTYLAEYGSSEITAATVATRILPLEVILPIFFIIIAFFVFSKQFYKKALTLPTLLFALWVFLPLILTQGYLVGLPVDYNRFLYFLVLPVLVFIAVLIDYGSGFFAETLDILRAKGKLQVKPLQVPKRLEETQRKLIQASKKISACLTRKRIYTLFVLSFLLICFGALPIFTAPQLNAGETLQSYYQTMDNEGWNALQWAKTNTPQGSVFVSDALYGWWLGGFAQRPTLSAVSPEYLTVKREVDNATFARNLMDTDYIVDNGWIQVQEDGYLSRHNPEILIDQNWTYAKYSFFTFSNQTEITYYDGAHDQKVAVCNLTVKDVNIKNDTQQAVITVTRGNNDLNYTIATTIYKDSRFANITSTITPLSPNVTFHWVTIKVQSNGVKIETNNNRTICMIDEGVKALGQLIFDQVPYEPPELDNHFVSITYRFEDVTDGVFKIYAGAYSVNDNLAIYADKNVRDAYFQSEIAENLAAPLRPVIHPDGKVYELSVFNYHLELQSREVAYVICRDQVVDPKFRCDPEFSLVFINEEVAIYKVNR
jgi:fumarate reductase subunit C